MRSLARFAIRFLIVFSLTAPGVAQEAEEHAHPPAAAEELGRAHMVQPRPGGIPAGLNR